MASNTVTIAGVTFPNVPAVDLAVSGGGTARYTDVSDTTATASDVASGKVFYKADGTQATGTASGSTLIPYAIRPDAELIKTWSYDKYIVADEGVTLPTYKTTSTILKTSADIGDAVICNLSQYKYFVAVRCLTIPTYNIATTGSGRIEYTISHGVGEIIDMSQMNAAALVNGTVRTSAYTKYSSNSNMVLMYWSNASTFNEYTSLSTSYGMVQTIQNVNISGSYPTSLAVSPNSPIFSIRGNKTYLTQTYFNAITDIRFQYVIELYREPIGNLNIDGWAGYQSMTKIIECVNSSTHKLS